MTYSSVLSVGQRTALSLMVDACTITRVTGAGTQNETTGRIVPTTTQLYAGQCQVRVPQQAAQAPEVGARSATIQGAIVKVPLAVEDVRIGDTVTITASVHDPELVGRVFTVAQLHHKTWPTARKLGVDEITA